MSTADTERGAENAPGGGGAPNGGDQGSLTQSLASGSPEGNSDATPTVGGVPPGKPTESDAKLEAMRAEIAKLQQELNRASSRRKSAKDEASSAAEQREQLAEELKGTKAERDAAAKASAAKDREIRVRDRIAHVVDQFSGAAPPKVLRALVKGSGVDLGSDDDKATMAAITQYLTGEDGKSGMLAALGGGRGLQTVPGSGAGGGSKFAGVKDPSGKRML